MKVRWLVFTHGKYRIKEENFGDGHAENEATDFDALFKFIKLDRDVNVEYVEMVADKTGRHVESIDQLRKDLQLDVDLPDDAEE